jgi:hypothetical protein
MLSVAEQPNGWNQQDFAMMVQLYSSNPRRIGAFCRLNLRRVYCQIPPVLVILQVGSHAIAMLEHSGDLIAVESYLNKLALNVAEVALKNLQLKTGGRMFASDGYRFHPDCLLL